MADPQTLEELEAMYSDDEYKKDKKKKGKAGKKGGATQKQEAEKEGNAEDGDKAPTNQDSVATEPASDQKQEQDDQPRIKTAAEKRKEKKERDKAKKAAAKDGAAKTDGAKADDAKADGAKADEDGKAGDGIKPDAAIAEMKKSPEESGPEAKEERGSSAGEKAESAADGGEAKENENAGEAAAGAEAPTEGLTAAQKKKLKKKEKDKAKKAAAAAPDAKAADAKKKPTSAVAKIIKQQLEKQREEEEKMRKQEEEEERKREEERMKREELERLERERKEKRKAKAKERKQKMKEEGRLLTTKQKLDRQRLQQMLEANEVELPAAAPADEGKADEEKKKKKPKYERLKRNRGPAHQAAAQEAAPVTEPQPASTAEAPQPDAEIVESWEQAADNTWDQIEVKEDWEDDDEDAKGEGASSSDEEEGGSDGGEESDDAGSSSSSESEGDTLERARHRIEQRRANALAMANQDKLRCPLVVVLGHVDTGKTSILDKLRRTHVQDGEAGGITQQIGATNVPAQAILSATRMVKSLDQNKMTLPGLLIIDTPGHESFSNLRSRGSSLCDVAILVVDIMHGIEPQTIESIQLLKQRKTPFIVALNKIDRLYNWQRNPNVDVYNTLKRQEVATKNDFNDRFKKVVAEFAMNELNVCLSCDNKNPDEYISLVPTSAHSGDGMGNLMAHICELSLNFMWDKLAFHEDLEATVMEVKEITGLGTTIDVCLVNGRLHEGDTIILAGQEGPIVTQVRGLLMPMPMKEMRVKNSYDKFKEVEGAQAVKIIAKDLEKALAGLPLYSSKDHDEIEIFKTDVSTKLRKVLKGIEVQDSGVYVQASTLGSLEALLLFLRTEKIPYCGINIGPVHKRDVTKCSIMLEKDPQWAVILAFDVKVEREAQEMADKEGVKIFTADIIYHLSDAFMKWREERMKAEKDKYRDVAVFPCKLRILPQFIFNSRDPIVCGVIVEAGVVRNGTPLAVPTKECVYLGRVESVESNHRKIDEARRGAEVCIKIAAPPGDAPKLYGRHFDHNDLLMSRVTRDSIDALKQYFRDEMQKDDWKLVIELKKAFGVM